MNSASTAPAPQPTPTLVAIEGGRTSPRIRATPTVVIMEIGDEEAVLWDAEVDRRNR